MVKPGSRRWSLDIDERDICDHIRRRATEPSLRYVQPLNRSMAVPMFLVSGSKPVSTFGLIHKLLPPGVAKAYPDILTEGVESAGLLEFIRNHILDLGTPVVDTVCNKSGGSPAGSDGERTVINTPWPTTPALFPDNTDGNEEGACCLRTLNISDSDSNGDPDGVRSEGANSEHTSTESETAAADSVIDDRPRYPPAARLRDSLPTQ